MAHLDTDASPDEHSFDVSATKTRSTRDAAAAERRDAILDAALACFVERGFHGTAVPQVAAQAGVGVGTLYHYFTGKEALVNALYRRCKEAIAQRVFTAFPPTASVREQFRAVWSEMADFALAEPRAFAFLELHYHGSYLDAESRAMENRLKDFTALVIGRAQADGVVKAGPPTLLMELAFGAFIGMMRAHGEGRVELDAAGRALAERACWDIIAEPGESRS